MAMCGNSTLPFPVDAPGKLPPKRKILGFTLLEVMLGLVGLAFLTVLSTTYIFLTRQSAMENLWRQQAFLALNGQMERLYAIYQYDTPEPQTSATLLYQSLRPLHPDRNHWIHSSAGIHQTLTVTDLPSFLESDQNNAVLLHNDQNLIWLDRDREITARMSWITDSLSNSGSCVETIPGAGPHCQMITLFLDFPYRYDAATGNPLAIDSAHKVQTWVLRTIVGKRYSS